MSGYRVMAACLPDWAAERAHLAALLQAGTSAADVASAQPPTAGTGGAGAGTGTPDGCSVLAWARSGLMGLTGPGAGPPLVPAAPVVARADAVVSAIADLTGPDGGRPELDASQVLAGRAAEAGWRRRGTVSANGTCQLLPAADRWLAVNLARPIDIRSLPAVLGRDLSGEPWAELRAAAAGRPAAELAAAAQLVGMPAAVLGADAPAPVRLSQLGERAPVRAARGLVLDLSAMWAGPLCASILGQAGWRVLKVEDSRRPDGARSGPPGFYARLHAGQPAIQLDFGSEAGRAELLRLAGMAAVVVESSRPRALAGLGLIAADWLAAAPGRTWVSVTGYGREDPQQRVAFGDDAAVAGGLVTYAADGTPVFCGDAIADPLTGLYAGLAALAADAGGGGVLIDVAMAGVCADVARATAGPLLPHLVRPAGRGWIVSHGATTEPVRTP
jgi:hypothetical protein